MGEWSGPWDGIGLGDAALIAPYNAAEWARIWRNVLHSDGVNEGVLVGSGIAPDIGLTVQQTTPAAAAIQVTPGAALVHGSWYQQYGLVAGVLAIDPNVSGNPRIDRVILRHSTAAQTIRLVILKGTPAGSPVPPSLTQSDGVTWEIPLARIAVANGFATITDANITPEWMPGGAAEGVYLAHILNRSAVDLETGDLVIWDTGGDRAVTTSTTSGVPVAGVWVGLTAVGAYGRMLVDGIGLVKTTGAVARGAWLKHSTTVKKADATATSTENVFATALAAVANGYTLSRVRIPAVNLPFNICTYNVPAAPITTNSGVFVDADAVNLKTTGYTRTGRIKVTMTLTCKSSSAGVDGYFTIKNQNTGLDAGDATKGLSVGGGLTVDSHLSMVWIFTGLSNDTAYEFRLRFCSATGGTNVTIEDMPVVMITEEV